MKYADGTCFDTVFRDNFLNGTGMYLWADKRASSGQWTKNIKEGYGYELEPNKQSLEGLKVTKIKWEKGDKKQINCPITKTEVKE